MRLYLASTSPARLTTLRAGGIEPVVLPSQVDEDAAVVAAAPESTAEMVLLLARLKAEAVAGRDGTGQLGGAGRIDDAGRLDGFILGADSAFELDGIGYGKPHTAAVARERWRLQRGRTGLLHTGHWLIDHRAGRGLNGDGAAFPAAGAVSTASVTFAENISDDEIDSYIATGEPLEVAGAFTIDSLGAPFISSITGDPHAVVGLSLATLRELFVGFGVSWPELWNR